MSGWERFAWAEEATEATVSLVEGAGDPVERLGPVEDAGPMTFEAALDLQNSFYDDGTSNDRAVVQADRLDACWGLVEPNGFRLSSEPLLLRAASGGDAVSFYWNVNSVMRLIRVRDGKVVTAFDPLLDTPSVDGADLPFEEHPEAAAFALVERWSGVAVTEAWFTSDKPTFVVEIPNL